MTDSTEAAFVEFLQYFYLTEVKLTVEHVVTHAGVLYLAEKYDVKKCVIDCIQLLMRTIDNENVCDYMYMAILYNIKQLMDACKKHIIVNTEAVFKTVSFLECDRQVIGHILEIDMLSCSEEYVFKACMAWVQAKSNCTEITFELVQQHLGDVYYKIRVASFALEKFSLLEIEFAKVLSRDSTTICCMLALPDCELVTPFTKKERKVTFNKDSYMRMYRELYFNHDRQRQHQPTKRYEFVKFFVDRPIILGGLSFTEIYATFIEDKPIECNVPAELEISENDNKTGAVLKILVTSQIQIDSNGLDIVLPDPVLLRRGFVYRMQIGSFLSFHHLIVRRLTRVCGHVKIMAESSPFVTTLTYNVL